MFEKQLVIQDLRIGHSISELELVSMSTNGRNAIGLNRVMVHFRDSQYDVFKRSD